MTNDPRLTLTPWQRQAVRAILTPFARLLDAPVSIDTDAALAALARQIWDIARCRRPGPKPRQR